MLPDPLEKLYEHLPIYIQFPLWIVWNIVFIRIILTGFLQKEISQHGFLDGRILRSIVNYLSLWKTFARKIAIVQHYRLGHQHNDVASCGQDRCRIFA